MNQAELLKLIQFSDIFSFLTPWTVAYQGPLSMGFPRQEYWSGCHPGDIPDPGIELASPTLVDDFFYH